MTTTAKERERKRKLLLSFNEEEIGRFRVVTQLSLGVEGFDLKSRSKLLLIQYPLSLVLCVLDGGVHLPCLGKLEDNVVEMFSTLK